MRCMELSEPRKIEQEDADTCFEFSVAAQAHASGG